MIDPSAFDQLLAELLSWEEQPPLSEDEVPRDLPSGYFAILSIYDGVTSKQTLLTLRDFLEPNDLEWDDAKHGRLYRAFDPVIELYD